MRSKTTLKDKDKKMKKVLIINLGNKNEIIKCANYVQIVKEKYPSSQISLLSDGEMKDLVSLINGLSQSYFLEVKDISAILNNPLYSDVFALNGLEESLASILKQEWDVVINYDNGHLSSILTSAIQSEKIYGSSLAHNLSIASCSPWSAYKNYASRSLISDDDIATHIIGMPNLKKDSALKIDSDFANIAKRNFDKILLANPGKTHFIGIQMNSSEYLLKDIFSYFLSETPLIPVYIHQSRPEEVKNLEFLNSTFNNKIISISSDTSAITAVIQNLSCYITNQTHLATIADLLGTTCIECLDDSIRLNSLRNFSGKHHFIDESASKIISLFESIGNDSVVSKALITSKQDDFGKYLISQRLTESQLIQLEFSRLIDLSLLGYKVDIKHYQQITKDHDVKTLKSLALGFKEDLGESIKKLLASLRAVRIASHSKDSMMSFLKNLDALFGEKEKKNISSSAIAIFEYKVESLDKNNSLNENLRKIEILLFELKNNFQTISSNIDILTGVVTQNEVTL